MDTIDKHITYFNFIDAFKEEGCSICLLLKKTIHKLMDSFLYEQINDPGVRNEIRSASGFCSLHAWQLRAFGNSLGLSIIYEDLMESAVTCLEQIAASEKSVKNFSAEISKIDKKNQSRKEQFPCPICRARSEAGTRYVSTFISSLVDPDFFSAYKNSSGLCKPHLRGVIKNCTQTKIGREVLNIELKKMKSLIEELKEIQRKHDYRFTHEGFGKEGNAWIRAIEKMTGKDGIF